MKNMKKVLLLVIFLIMSVTLLQMNIAHAVSVSIPQPPDVGSAEDFWPTIFRWFLLSIGLIMVLMAGIGIIQGAASGQLQMGSNALLGAIGFFVVFFSRPIVNMMLGTNEGFSSNLKVTMYVIVFFAVSGGFVLTRISQLSQTPASVLFEALLLGGLAVFALFGIFVLIGFVMNLFAGKGGGGGEAPAIPVPGSSMLPYIRTKIFAYFV